MEVEYQQTSHAAQLQKYYRLLYPANLLCSWFGYARSEDGAPNLLLSRREFSMTLQIGQDEIYKRYMSFKSAKDFRNALIREIPIKMDIGAIYQEIPKKGGINVAQQKEFILDLDIDSYDNVRPCCKKASICKKCWRLMRVAAKILYRTMEEDFGFENMLFVFSGRRGMHLWVCDQRARSMPDSLRRSTMEYMHLVTGNDKSNSQLAEHVLKERDVKYKKLNCRRKVKELLTSQGMHPLISKSLKIIRKDFLAMFQEQNILMEEEQRSIVQKILRARSEKLLQNVKSRWARSTTTLEMYKAIQDELESYQRYPNEYKSNETIPPLDLNDNLMTASFVEQEIMLTFMYPRLDIGVSTAKNHLLKCPFSIHPKTLMISVPFEYEMVDRFDPQKCITLPELLQDAEQIYRSDPDKYNTPEILARETQGLSDAIRTLQRFVKNTLRKLKTNTNSLQI